MYNSRTYKKQKTIEQQQRRKSKLRKKRYLYSLQLREAQSQASRYYSRRISA